jgi:hypothetical protein
VQVREFKSDVLHEVDDEENDDAVPVHLVSNPKPKITRRNSTGTIYVDRFVKYHSHHAHFELFVQRNESSGQRRNH